MENKYVRCRQCDSAIDIESVGVANTDERVCVFECPVCGNDDMSRVFEYEHEDNHDNLSDAIGQLESAISRFVEAEKFLIYISELPWYRKMFCGSKIIEYLKSVIEKYEN